ncbi:MAG TPA: hypothetical protein VJO35_18825 [Terriglobales bacterium]|nr:hypothetical protein [Terriglobales bacterium]
MSRHDFDHEPDELRNSESRHSGQDEREPRDRQSPRFREVRPKYVDIELSAQLSETKLRTLIEIGTFRAVNFDDLVRYRYQGDERAARQELNDLARLGFVRRQTITRTDTEQYSLTRSGYGAVEERRDKDSEQVLYHGFVKPKEAEHDSAIYRLYERAAQEITESGGRVTRVVLDFELKRSINRQLARASSMSPDEQARRKQEIAEEHGLKVINGRIAIPDLRLEYETADREPNKVDLELVTGHYRGHSLSEKAQAGFRMFASEADRAHLRAAIADPEIMQEILSL